MAVPVLLQDNTARVSLCLLADTPRSVICWGRGCQDGQSGTDPKGFSLVGEELLER